MKISFFEVRKDNYNYPIIVNKKSSPVEIILFNYMSQLEKIDPFAYVAVVKGKDSQGVDRLSISSYRTNYSGINFDELDKIPDKFSRYILNHNDDIKIYESLFDVDIPYKKCMFLVKCCDDLFIKDIIKS